MVHSVKSPLSSRRRLNHHRLPVGVVAKKGGKSVRTDCACANAVLAAQSKQTKGGKPPNGLIKNALEEQFGNPRLMFEYCLHLRWSYLREHGQV